MQLILGSITASMQHGVERLWASGFACGVKEAQVALIAVFSLFWCISSTFSQNLSLSIQIIFLAGYFLVLWSREKSCCKLDWASSYSSLPVGSIRCSKISGPTTLDDVSPKILPVALILCYLSSVWEFYFKWNAELTLNWTEDRTYPWEIVMALLF